MRRGVETMVLSLSNELVERGVDVSILAARQTQTPLVTPAPQVKVKQFPTFRFFEFLTIAPMYAADLIREHYDIIIVFFAEFGEGQALRFAAPFARPRLMLYLTFPYEAAPHRYEAYARWKMGGRAAAILADAEYTARRGSEFFHRPVQVLPSGTDPQRFKPDAVRRKSLRAKLGYGGEDIVLLNVSALEARKGVWRVIEAMHEIYKAYPNVRYLILGEGSERRALEQRVRELGLESAILFAGTTDNLAPYYNAADIFVMLPEAEAGSIALLEAMSSSLPCIVSDTGGFGEVISPKNGRLANPGNGDEIVATILELASDPRLRESLGEAGRTTVIERYSWKYTVDLFCKLCS